MTPLDGALDVTPGAAVTLSFSRSIDPASTGALRVETSAGLAIAGAVTLSDDDRIATFRPSGSWPEKTTLVVRADTTLRDRTSRALPAAFASQFTTFDSAAPPPPPAGSITATLPVNGSVTVTGTQGSAGLRDTVRIVNLTKRTFFPVLVNPDGSFSVNVPATVRDTLTVSITGASGNETSVALPAFTTTNADGSRSTFVGAEGGRVAGPNGIAVDVPAGAFPDGTVVTVNSVAEADFPMSLSADQRELLGFTAGLELDFAGATPPTYLDVSVPAGPNDRLSDRWVLVGVLEAAGRTFLTATDTAKVIDGRIVTGSPPCPGVQAATKYGFVKSTKQPVGVILRHVRSQRQHSKRPAGRRPGTRLRSQSSAATARAAAGSPGSLRSRLLLPRPFPLVDSAVCFSLPPTEGGLRRPSWRGEGCCAFLCATSAQSKKREGKKNRRKARRQRKIMKVKRRVKLFFPHCFPLPSLHLEQLSILDVSHFLPASPPLVRP